MALTIPLSKCNRVLTLSSKSKALPNRFPMDMKISIDQE